MVSVIILSFVTGVLVSSGAPHFVQGAGGHKHTTPFGKDGSAIENIVWGWLSMVVGVIVWHFAPMASHPRAAFVGAAAGALVAGLTLATALTRK